MAWSVVASGIVQSATSNGMTSATFNSTGADTLIVFPVSLVGQSAAVTDNKSSTFDDNTSDSDVRTGFWIAKNITGGTGHTVTIGGTGNYPVFAYVALSGGHATSPVIQTIGPSAFNSVTSVQPGAFTHGEAGAFCVTLCAFNSSASRSVNSGYGTPIQIANAPGAAYGMAIAHQTQTTYSAVNPTWSWTGTESNIVTFQAAFRPASATVTVGLTGVSATTSLGLLIGSQVLTFVGLRRASINGFVSRQAETNGWNAKRASIPDTAFVRTAASVATLTLPAIASYSITANETIDVVVPGDITTSGTTYVVGSFTVADQVASIPLLTVFATGFVTAPRPGTVKGLTGIGAQALQGFVRPGVSQQLVGVQAQTALGVFNVGTVNVQAPTDAFRVGLLNGLFAFGATEARATTAKDTFKVALYYMTASLGPDTTVYSTSGEVTGSGYTAGGVAVANTVDPANTGAIAYWTPSSAFTFSSITISTPFDAILLYNDAFATKRAVAVFKFNAQTVTAGTFTMAMPANTASSALIRLV